MTIRDVQIRQAGAVINRYVTGGDYATLVIGSESIRALLEETSSDYDYELATMRDRRSLQAKALATEFVGTLGQSWKCGQTISLTRSNGKHERWRLDRAELSPDSTVWTLIMSDD